MQEIYLDFQASTPVDPAVLDVMLPWLASPANPHANENGPGRRAAQAVENARAQVAALLGADLDDIIFTSGATEAANIVLRSLAGPGSRLIVSAIEHSCVRETAAALADAGVMVEIAPVDSEGLVDLDALGQLLESPAALLSIMAVNNEVGTIQPLIEIASMGREAGALTHSDIAQGAGRIPLRQGRDFDVATLSAHKLYGPQGIGAIAAPAAVRKHLRPIATGGGQQAGLRPGTLPVMLAVGMGEACRLAALRLEEDRAHAEHLAGHFLDRLRISGIEPIVNGSTHARVPHNLNLSFPPISAEEILARTPGLALSTGSACSSGAIEPSRVLSAMGVEPDIANGAIRVGFGRTTTVEMAESAADQIASVVRAAQGG
jgi:cysteine desulfurase